MSGDRVDFVVEPVPGSGEWYWALKVNGEIYADGDGCENRMIAQSRCQSAYDEFMSKQ